MNSPEFGQGGVDLECIRNSTASFGSKSVVFKTAHNKQNECRNLDAFLWALFVGDWNNTHGWCGVQMRVRNIVHAFMSVRMRVRLVSRAVSTRVSSSSKNRNKAIDALKISSRDFKHHKIASYCLLDIFCAAVDLRESICYSLLPFFCIVRHSGIQLWDSLFDLVSAPNQIKMVVVNIFLKWGKQKLDVAVDTAEGADVFLAQVFALTGIPPDQVKILAKGTTIKSETHMDKLGLKEGAVLMVMGGTAAVVAKPDKPVVFAEDLNDDQLVAVVSKSMWREG